jgi:uncharacterized membrane protein YkoI
MRFKTAIVVALTLLTAAPDLASAQGRGRGNAYGRERQDEAYDARREGRIVPLEQVIGQIRARVGGRLLDADLQDRGGRPIYIVRWSSGDGRRIDFVVDAQTGAILSGG